MSYTPPKRIRKKIDNNYAKFCRNSLESPPENIKIIRKVNPSSEEEHRISLMMRDIGIFSSQILREFRKLHIERTDPNKDGNDPTSKYLKLDQATKNLNTKTYTNTKYHPLRPICMSGEDMKCDKAYTTQRMPKSFIPHLTHIVLDFGILQPLGISNLKHIQQDGQIPQPIFDNKFHILNTELGTILSPQDHLDRGLDSWSRRFRREVAHRRQQFGHPISNFSHQSIPIDTDDGVEDKFMETMIDLIIGSGMQEQEIYKIFERLDTVARLRLFDLFVCNNYNRPENSENLAHSIVYINTIDIRSKLKIVVNYAELSSELGILNVDVKSSRIPPVDDDLKHFIDVDLVRRV